MSKDTLYDIVIIGAGAAGLTAALYGARRALNVIVLTKDIGGQASRTPEIENYPGLPLMDGFDMMQLFQKQAEKFGAKVEFRDVERIEKKSDGNFTVHTNDGGYNGKSIILAFGLTPRNINVPGEEEYKGKGVSYCATCDAPLFKNQTVAVIGGGPHAMDAAELLSRIGKHVSIVHQATALAGNANLKQTITNTKNIDLFLGYKVVEVKGDERVKQVVIENKKDGTQTTLDVTGIFVELGYAVQSDWVKEWVEFDARKQIIVTRAGLTKTPGIFAAGDVTTESHKQVVISAGEGARAALEAYRYIQTQAGKPGLIAPDWGFVEK